MSKDINNLIKPVMSNGKIVTHKVTDPSLGVDSFFYSTFIQKQDIILKGEIYHRNYSRNALLVFFDLQTGQVKGRF